MNWKLPLLLLLSGAASDASTQIREIERSSPVEERTFQEEQLAEGRAHAERLAGALAEEGGARALALAAILHAFANFMQDQSPPESGMASRGALPDPRTEAWLRSASAEAGADVMANQLLIAADNVDEGLRLQAARRWQAAEPDNLAPLMHQRLPVDALLVQARSALRSDHHTYDNVRWIMLAYLRHPPVTGEAEPSTGGKGLHPEESAAIAAMGIWVAVASPSYSEVSEACRGNALHKTPDRRADCRHVATLLAEHGDTVTERRIGLRMLREIVGSPQARAEIDLRRRCTDWQLLSWFEASSRQERDGAAQFVRLLRDVSIRSEQQLMERALREAGTSLEPPAGWHSPWN